MVYAPVEVNSITTNQWVIYNPSPIMKINNNYIYNAGDNYFITRDYSFSGKIVDSLPLSSNNKFGDIVLLKTSGEIYELTYQDDTTDEPFVWKVLCDEQSYFKIQDDSGECKNYIINNIGLNSYIFDRPNDNYFVGEIITQTPSSWVNGKYYSLKYNLGSFNNRNYVYGNICLYENNELNIVLRNGEPYEIYYNGVENVFTGIYYGLKEYDGYSNKVNNINDLPSVRYKIDSMVMTIKDNNVKVYKMENNYIEIQLLPKTIFKDKLTGKIFIIIDNLIDEIKPGIKLNDVIVDKYIKANFKDISKSINLLNSTARIIRQYIPGTSKDFIKFNPQPPKEAINLNMFNVRKYHEYEYIIENKYNINNINIIKNINGDWLFDSKYIDLFINEPIIFEYYDQGEIITLLYWIKRNRISNTLIASSIFNGELLFENEQIINNKYILELNYVPIIGNYIILNGILKIPESGVYDITVIIYYKYVAIVDNYNVNNVYYSINMGNDELVKENIKIVNYNITQNNNKSMLTNNSLTMNILLNLEKNDELFIVYNNNDLQIDVEYNNCYFNASEIARNLRSRF